jgi:hypothetical protein
MEKTNLIAYGTMLIGVPIAYLIGGPWGWSAATVAGFLGIVLLVKAHFESLRAVFLGKSRVSLAQTHPRETVGQFAAARNVRRTYKGEELREQAATGRPNAPRLFLDFDNAVSARYGEAYSGLFLKNDGGTAFNVHFEPEERAGLTFHIDDPNESIAHGKPFPVRLMCCEIRNGMSYPVGGLQSGQVASLFKRLENEGQDEQGFAIIVRCVDYDKNPVESRSLLRRDIWTNQIRCERI